MTLLSGPNHFANAILEVLDETFDTHHGLYLDRETSLFVTLASVSAEEASRPVSASCASIAAQVNHVTYYLEVLNGDLSGNEATQVDWKEAWTIGPVDDAKWAVLVGRLRTAADETMASLRSTMDWSEDAAFAAVSIAVHTAHHLGEIRQALCTIQSRSQGLS